MLIWIKLVILAKVLLDPHCDWTTVQYDILKIDTQHFTVSANIDITFFQ